MVLFCLLFFILLISPKTTHLGVKNGLVLLENQVIPSLYPFILFSSYIRTINPICSTPFMITVGMFSGYPIGAKIIDSLHITNLPFSRQELLILCNLPSPAYMLSFVGFQSFGHPLLGLLIYLCIIIGNVFAVLFLRMLNFMRYSKKEASLPPHTYKHIQIHNNSTQEPICVNQKIQFTFSTVIRESFSTLGNIITYLLIFSIASAFIEQFKKVPQLPKALFTGFLETTTGISALITCNLSLNSSLVIVTGMICFGGLSVIAQTSSVIQSTDLSIKKYMTDKALASTIAMSVMYGITILLFN